MGVTKRWMVVAGLLMAAGLTAGCVWPRGPEDMRRHLARDAGVRLDREVGITIGPLGMALVRWAVRHSDEEPEIDLRGVRRVEVGVYRVEGPRRGRDGHGPLSPPVSGEWNTMVRVREPGEEVFVLGQERGGELRRLVVVVAEPDEWVLVRLTGRLQPVLEQALEMAFDEAERSELYPAVAEALEQRESEAGEGEGEGAAARDPTDPRQAVAAAHPAAG